MGDTFVNQVQRVGDDSAGLAPGRAAVLFDATQFDVTDQPDTIATAQDGGSITGVTLLRFKSSGTLTNPVVTGTITQGTSATSTGFAATTGQGTATLVSFPLADDSAAYLSFEAPARSSGGALAVSATRTVLTVDSGTLDVSAPPTLDTCTLGLSPGLDYDWTAGVLSIVIQGPNAHVSAAANNGAGKVRLTVDGGLSSGLSGQSITISGLSVCTEANGAHVATYIDATHLDLLGVSIVHTGTDSGTAVLTTPPVIRWKGWARLTAAT